MRIRNMRIAMATLALIVMSIAGASAAPTTTPATVPSITRTPKWPLKDRRTLFSDAEIAAARANAQKYRTARAVADQIIKDADWWLAWDDRELASLIPHASVPRAFDVSAGGCPKCGKQIVEKFGGFPWIVDPKKPLQVKCPVDGTVFPSNEYPDDGWGWTDPKTGEKYWFVAYANHWTIFGKVVPGTRALARAYLLTGDKRYAHKALVAVHRFAEVYPAMDHAAQSRYGTMMQSLGRDYPGKIVNRIWETDLVTSLAEAYDACWDAIDSDAELQQLTGKSGQQLRAFIEANLLEDAIDAYFQAKIRGNFGMHQQTLAHLAIVRQHGETERLLDSLMDDAGASPQMLGLNYALYNFIFRDGIPFETAVHYNSIWLERISQYARLLEKTGRRPFEIPKLKRIYDGALAMICARAHNPSIGDGGTIWGGIIRPDLPSYQIAYRRYRDERCGQYLAAFGATGDGSFGTFESLMSPPIEIPAPATTGPTTPPAQPSRLLDGYGMAFLNNRQDSVALALYYGLKAGHGHFDRLHFDIYANGQPMMPDLGYPDAMNEFVPGIFTWSQNTIAHNTVVVDAARQPANVPGTVELFADGSFARVIDVSATGTYPQCAQYRRAVIMVDSGEAQAYFIDIFTVSGGKQHDYSLHGPPGAFEALGGEWSEQAHGTLAGEDVEVGQIYDDPKLGAPGYTGGYSGYKGSGFQHLYNVRRLASGQPILQWSHEKDASAKLRIRVLEQPGQQLILANARASPMKFPQVLTYLIARRQGDDLASRFVSVIEPYQDEPLIESVRAIQLDAERIALEVHRPDGSVDTICYEPQGAQLSVQRRDASGNEAGRFEVAGRDVAKTGTVVDVDPARSQIRIRAGSTQIEANDFVGRVVQFSNDLRRTAHPIAAAAREGDQIVLTTADDLLVGRARVDEVDGDSLLTQTALPLARTYVGVTLADARFRPLGRVAGVEPGRIRLAAPLARAGVPNRGDDVWLINVGPGDGFALPAISEASR